MNGGKRRTADNEKRFKASGQSPFPHTEALLEFAEVDDSTAMGSLPDPALIIPGFNREEDALGIHAGHLRDCTNTTTNRGGRQVADIYFHSDADKSIRQGGSDGRSRSHFHMQDHHGRRIDQRHAGDKMPNRHLSGDDKVRLGRQAGFQMI